MYNYLLNYFIVFYLYICSTRWHSNPYVNGSYSYISTDCDQNETISKHLLSQALKADDFYGVGEGCGVEKIGIVDSMENVPIVLFAGEACHEKYFSTAHGAFLSGMEQAQKLLKHYD